MKPEDVVREAARRAQDNLDKLLSQTTATGQLQRRYRQAQEAVIRREFAWVVPIVEAAQKAREILLPYCQQGEDETMYEAAVQWLEEALAKLPGAGEESNNGV